MNKNININVAERLVIDAKESITNVGTKVEGALTTAKTYTDTEISKLVGDGRVSIEVIRDFICNRPRANVKEIVYAHWEKADGMGYYRCSHCKTVDNKYYQPEYCPHCGAEMSEVIE